MARKLQYRKNPVNSAGEDNQINNTGAEIHEAKTDEAKPAEAKPAEAKPTEVKPDKQERPIGEWERYMTERKYTPARFLKNDQYFTMCIYAFVLVVASAIAIKAIVSFDQTKVFIGGILRAVSPFFIALLIAYLLTPFVRAANRLLRRVFPKLPEKPAMVISLLIVYIIGLGLIIMLLVYVLPEVVRNLVDMIGLVPKGYAQLLEFVQVLQERFPGVDFSSIREMLQNTQTDLVASLQNIASEIIPVLYTASVSVVTWLANFLIALIVSVYMLYGKKSLLRILKIVLYSVVPKDQIPIIREIVVDCNNIFSNFVVSKMIDSLIIGLICLVLMTILRLPYVFLISAFVGITNMIPYFGPFIGAIPGIVIILVISPVKALVFAIMILCLQQFDGLVLGPKLLGNSTGMKPIWIIFAITIGGKFFGVPGMFLGVPVVAILAYLAERYMSAKLRRKDINIEDIQ